MQSTMKFPGAFNPLDYIKRAKAAGIPDKDAEFHALEMLAVREEVSHIKHEQSSVLLAIQHSTETLQQQMIHFQELMMKEFKHFSVSHKKEISNLGYKTAVRVIIWLGGISAACYGLLDILNSHGYLVKWIK